MPRPRPSRDPCDCRDCLEGDEVAAAAARGVGFLDGVVVDEKEGPSSAKKNLTSSTAASSSSSAPLTGTRAARQDPPPRALLLLCDGMLRGLIKEATASSAGRRRSPGAEPGAEAEPGFSTFPHLDAVARGGAVGTLALRRSAETDDPRLRRHAALFQLLGAHLVSSLRYCRSPKGEI